MVVVTPSTPSIPTEGRLTGGVFMVTGASGTVQNVTIDGSRLTAPCIVATEATSLSAVLFDHATGEISGVTVRTLQRALPASADVHEVGGHASCGSGITVVGATVPVLLEKNTIVSVGDDGISIEGGAASIAHNTIDGAAAIGILASGEAHVRISPDNQVRNGFVGIQFEGVGTGGRIAGNTVETMARDGIRLLAGTHVTLANNTVRHPGRSGILVSEEGTTATIEANTVEDSASIGIWVEGGAQATITGNTVTDAASDGIAAISGANVVISGGNAIRGGERGIEIGGADTTGTVTGNRVERVDVVGITINRGATARDVSGNTVVGGQFGIVTLGVDTSATVTGNSVSGQERTGFTVEDGASAELRRNHVTRADWGILVTGSGTTAELSENRIEQTTTAGIVLATGSQTTATSNTVSMSGIDGIRIQDVGTAATVRGNDVSGITNQGITVLYGARATVSDNAISGGATGVLVKDRGSAIVEGNTIHDVTYSGISVEHTPAPAATTPGGTRAGGVAIVSQDIYFDPKTVTIPANTDVTVRAVQPGCSRAQLLDRRAWHRRRSRSGSDRGGRH